MPSAPAAPQVMLRDLQDAFRRGVFVGDERDAVALIRRSGITPEQRLSIYRNNTYGSLINVLQAAYPVVCRLVGERFFRYAARGFVAGSPPTAPRLSAYGGGLGDYLAGFEPARSVPYLADVARLEWARHEAYFAADAVPIAPVALQAVAPERYAGLRFDLHPSVRLVSSPFAVLSIWRANQPENETVPRVDPRAGGERAMAIRPNVQVELVPLAVGDWTLVCELATGASLEEAVAVAGAAEPTFDLQRALLEHLTRGTFRAFRDADEPQGDSQ